MNVQMDFSIADGYKSASQIARVVSEGWVAKNLYCPRCGCDVVDHLKNNSPVADFQCPSCGNIFESKAMAHDLGYRVTDGAYDTMLRRIHDEDNPDFLFMSYDRENWQVRDFLIVPKYYFHDSLIEKRTPLPSTARRAGWVGCNILLGDVPISGKISFIRSACVRAKDTVEREYRETAFLAGYRLRQRGWLMHMLQCLDAIEEEKFSLSDVYAFSGRLSALHPENHNIEAKIRQQLQILRDKGVLEFVGRGSYRKMKKGR